MEDEEAGLQLPPLTEAAPAAVLAAAGTQTLPDAPRNTVGVQAGGAALSLPLPRGLLDERGAQTAAPPPQRGAALQAGRPQLRLVSVNATQTDPAAGTSVRAAQTSPGLGTAAASVQVRMERVRRTVAATGAQAGTPRLAALAAGAPLPARVAPAEPAQPTLAGGAAIGSAAVPGAAARNGGMARRPPPRAPRLALPGEAGEDGLLRMSLPDDHQPTRVVPDRAAMEAAQHRQAEARRVREQRQQQAEEQRARQRERQRQQREAEEEAQPRQPQQPASAAATTAAAAALSSLAGHKRTRSASAELATPRVAQVQQAAAPALQLSPLMLAAQRKIRQRQLELQRQRQQLLQAQQQQQEWQPQQLRQLHWPQGQPAWVAPPPAVQEPAAPPCDGWQHAKRPRLAPLPRLSRSPQAFAAAAMDDEEEEQQHHHHQAGGWRASCPPPPAPRAVPQPRALHAAPAGAALAAAAPASAGYAPPLGAAPRSTSRLTPLMAAQQPAVPGTGHTPAAAAQQPHPRPARHAVTAPVTAAAQQAQPSPRRQLSPYVFFRPTEEQLAAAEAEAEVKAAALIERLRARAAQR